MAHRALVAYRDGDSYHLRYAHDGDGVAEQITAATPLGGRSDRTAARSRDAWATDRFDLDPAESYACRTRVDPRPLARRVSPDQMLAAIDLTVETLVVVDADYDCRTYAVCPLGIDGGGPLVVVGPTDDPASIRRTLVEHKERLGQAVDAGDLDTATARRALRRTLAERAPVHTLDDASFL